MYEIIALAALSRDLMQAEMNRTDDGPTGARTSLRAARTATSSLPTVRVRLANMLHGAADRLAASA